MSTNSLKQATLYKINVHTLQKVWTFLEIRVWTFLFPRSLIADIFELFPGLHFGYFKQNESSDDNGKGEWAYYLFKFVVLECF